jgi:hypothetical protein
MGAGAAVLGGVALVVSEALLRPAHEVLYSASLVVADCRDTHGRKLCFALYSVSIANSGRLKQDEVRLEWGFARENLTLSTKVTDLVASAAARSDPRIIETPGERGTTYEIRDFDPNTLVELRLSCVLCPPEEIRALRDAPMRVHAKGRVVNADPRGTMLGRALRNLARALDVFY